MRIRGIKRLKGSRDALRTREMGQRLRDLIFPRASPNGYRELSTKTFFGGLTAKPTHDGDRRGGGWLQKKTLSARE
jgi:hypothetical protein